jgi:predicted rRNA methylase YqxC with S4 and FtsJ domains
VRRGGIVRDQAGQVEAIGAAIQAFAAAGIAAQALTHSPIKGPAGNIEFLLGSAAGAQPAAFDIEGAVKLAHETLGR